MNALFLDLSNMNVMFKQEDRFVLGACYQKCPEQLLLDAQSLGSSYDIYVSLLPRIVGEGDIEIKGLSHGRVPFVALKSELKPVVDYLQKFHGASSIYFCNSFANFISRARVNTFQTVLPYGNRFAMLDVHDKIIDSIEVYESQYEFKEKMGESFTCYGDLDLIDVDGIKSQYPEFFDFNGNALLPVINMVCSYRSAYQVLMEDVVPLVQDAPVAVIEEPEEEPAPKPPKKEVAKPKPVEKEEIELPKPKVKRKKKKKVDVVSILFLLIIAAGAFGVGFGYSVRGVSGSLMTFNSNVTQYKKQAEPYAAVERVYRDSYNMALATSTVISAAQTFEQPISIVGTEVSTENLMLTFTCNSVDTKDAFVTFMDSKFMVLAVNEGQPMNDAGGNTIFQFTLTIIP